MDEFGHFGYAVWFGLIEIIAKENGNTITGKLSISPTYLRRKLRTSSTKLRQVLTFCQGFAKVSVNFSEKKWDIDFPKIAEIKDNYTKDLQATSKKPSKHKEVYKEEKEKEKEKKKKPEIKKDKYGEFKNVFLTKDEYERLLVEYPRVQVSSIIEELSEYLKAKGKIYKDYNAAIRSWLRRKGVEKVKICTAKNPAIKDEAGWRHPDTKEVTNKELGATALRCVHCRQIFPKV